MYIMNEGGTEVVNSDFVERFCVSTKPDATLVMASYGVNHPTSTLARYKYTDEAKSALADLLTAIAGGQTYYFMPASTYYDEQETTKDARVKRRGGS